MVAKITITQNRLEIQRKLTLSNFMKSLSTQVDGHHITLYLNLQQGEIHNSDMSNTESIDGDFTKSVFLYISSLFHSVCIYLYHKSVHLCMKLKYVTTTYWNKLVTDNPNPVTAPNLSGVTGWLMKSDRHTKQLEI